MREDRREEELLASLYVNFRAKGQQKDDWITIAEKMNDLKRIYGGSERAVAKNSGLSSELVRSTLKLLNLSDEIKSLVRSGKISQDLGWRLLGIPDEKRRLYLAKAITNLSAHDARDIIRFAKNNPKSSIDAQIERLAKSRKKPIKVILTVVSLDEPKYELLKEEAKKSNIPLRELISKIIAKWLAEHDSP